MGADDGLRWQTLRLKGIQPDFSRRAKKVRGSRQAAQPIMLPFHGRFAFHGLSFVCMYSAA